jgi:hypothetical protein
LATETTPEALDATILDQAGRPARKRSPILWPWYRPMVFMALFGLSLALLLEFSELARVNSEIGPQSALEEGIGAETLLGPKQEWTVEERDDAAAWWACIQELEAAGNTSAAEEELRQLLAAYPGFKSVAPAER